jgi:hypothetical protein
LKNLLLILLLLVSCTSFALNQQEQCEYNGIDYKVATKFIHDFKLALHKNDRNSIANFASYPLRINTAPRKYYVIRNKKGLLAKYDSIFNANAIKVILNDNAVFCNFQGGMLGPIWYKTDKHNAKFFVVNVQEMHI